MTKKMTTTPSWAAAFTAMPLPPPRSSSRVSGSGSHLCGAVSGGRPCSSVSTSAMTSFAASCPPPATRVQVSCDDCRSFICDGAFICSHRSVISLCSLWVFYFPCAHSMTKVLEYSKLIFSRSEKLPPPINRMSLVPRVPGKP